jgi:hypothetical protein
MTITDLITDQIAAVCPIDGMSFGIADDKSTWRIDFNTTATDAQKLAANTLLQGFDIPAAKSTIAAQAAIPSLSIQLYTALVAKGAIQTTDIDPNTLATITASKTK